MSVADLHNKTTSAGMADVTTFAAEFAEDASSLTDRVSVIIPAFHVEKAWGPCRWMPRVDASGDPVLPSEGDSCVVVLAETEDPGTPDIWVVAWWTE